MIQKDGHTDVASSRRMCKTIIEDAEDILAALNRDMQKRLYQPGGRINLQKQLTLTALEII